MTRQPKITLWRNHRHRYRFKLCASNGKPICYSQQEYRTKEAALVGIRALVSAAVWFDAHDEQIKAIEKAEKRRDVTARRPGHPLPLPPPVLRAADGPRRPRRQAH
jgi:uncharacterized protein YegP (UPF0339 family)